VPIHENLKRSHKTSAEANYTMTLADGSELEHPAVDDHPVAVISASSYDAVSDMIFQAKIILDSDFWS